VDIWELDKLLLFLAFVIPGFVSIKVYQLAFPGTERATSDQLVDAVAYSSVNYALLLLPIIAIERGGVANTRPFLYYSFYLVVLFIAPIVWVLAWKYIRTRDFFQRSAPHPTAKPWDFVFQQRRTVWVKVTLQNGTVIGGRYSDRSFASSAPAEEQIYLEETWLLGPDGEFVRKKRETAGVLITSKEISHLEFRNSKDTDHVR
jgi:hypothetical protein